MSLKELKDNIESINKAKDQAYWERNQLVLLLTKIWPSYRSIHEDPDWEEGWNNIIYIDSPMGQLSWHIHDSELKLFPHLLLKDNRWDGHTTEQKYKRLRKYPLICPNCEESLDLIRVMGHGPGYKICKKCGWNLKIYMEPLIFKPSVPDMNDPKYQGAKSEILKELKAIDAAIENINSFGLERVEKDEKEESEDN